MAPATPQDSGPHTPPRRGSPPSVKTSPITHVSKYFVAHKRDEVQAFGYDKQLHQVKWFNNPEPFLQFLDVGNGIIPLQVPASARLFSMDTFVGLANKICESIRTDHFTNQDPLLVFKDTGNKIQLGHVTDTECRPDITAAFEGDWFKDEITLWPCIRLAGERASKRKTREQQRKQAISYLHYLLLARPDLDVAQGLLTRKAEIVLLVGTAGRGISVYPVKWDNPNLYKLLYAFIYRLYKPGPFEDQSYIKTEVDTVQKMAFYTVRINVPAGNGSRPLDCPDFHLLAARNPFATRTLVLSSPHSQVEVGGKVISVLKDQLCRSGTRFEEQYILSVVHGPGTVPGVIEAVYHETIASPRLDGRIKQRLGFRQTGSPFTDISTLRKVLETLYDLLEVLRFLHSHRRVLHRDISMGNVLYIEDSSYPLPDPQTAEEMSLYFIKHVLGESDNPHKTSMLLIDFNHAEHLDTKQGAEHERVGRTGTPIFIARAVELGKPVPCPERMTEVPAVPDSPDAYAAIHQDRIRKFPPTEELMIRKSGSNQSQSRQWTHELDHDAESVFWLLLYWAMAVQPVGSRDEAIKSGPWSNLLGDADDRDSLVLTLANMKQSSDLTHSLYKPLGSLIKELAAILVVDRYWLPESDVRNDPEYIAEAFQRLILKFILDNGNQTFMDHHVDTVYRKVKQTAQSDALSATSSQRKDADARKRPSPQPTTEAVAPKRRRLNRPRTEDADDEHMNADEDDDDDDDDGGW